MSPVKPAANIFERYDQGFRYARHKLLPPDQPIPKPTSEWLPENRAFLTKYEHWLLGGGASEEVTYRLYIPMACHVLGLFMRPHDQLDLDRDLQLALDYVIAKQVSKDWIEVSKVALDRFRRFLMQERGIEEITIAPYKHELHTEGLPDWLTKELKRYQLLRQRNWRPARVEENIRRFWSGYLRTWRYLCKECGVAELSDLKRGHIYDYMEHRLKAGYAPSGINGDVRSLKGFLGFLQDQEYTIPQSLLRIPGLKSHQRMPRFLTDQHVRLLRDDLEQRVQDADQAHKRRDALLDRAAFYLLWQGGMRLGEVEELRLEDLQLKQRWLSIRNSKGLKDRTVYLTDRVIDVLEEYLKHRGSGPSDHVFMYRNRALRKDLVRRRIKAAGKRVGVKVYPHRLRHTCATQLLNAGCKVTSIQRFLGHKRLNTTMIYARVHDHTVAEDYYTAMEQVEQRLDLIGDVKVPITKDERSQLLSLADQLATSDLTRYERFDLTAQMQWVLNYKNRVN